MPVHVRNRESRTHWIAFVIIFINSAAGTCPATCGINKGDRGPEEEIRMSIYVSRLRDGNCIVTNAPDQERARKNVEPLAASEVVNGSGTGCVCGAVRVER